MPAPTVTVPSAPSISKATNGDETELYLSLNGTSWVSAGEVTDLPDLPSGEQSTYSTTHMKSASFNEFKKNKRKEGTETDIVGNYSLEDGLATLEAAEAAIGTVPYLLVLKEGADTYHATGHALFMNLRRSNPADEGRKFTITAKWQSPMAIAKVTA